MQINLALTGRQILKSDWENMELYLPSMSEVKFNGCWEGKMLHMLGSPRMVGRSVSYFAGMWKQAMVLSVCITWGGV